MRHLFFYPFTAYAFAPFETSRYICGLSNPPSRMKLLKIYPTSVNRLFIDEAAEALGRGDCVVIPTDSLYAIGCDALDARAIERLCRLKGIDTRKDQLSILCADISMASEYARIDNRAFRYLREYLPGPATFILPAATTLPKVFKGRRTVGIRVSSDPVAGELCKVFGRPILVTTALPSPEEASEPDAVALAYAGRIDLMLDSGSSDAAMPTTVVDLTDSSTPVVVREGLTDFQP